MSAHKKAIIALIIANTIWGAASPIFKWSLTNITPFSLAFLRFALSAIILFPFCINKLAINKKDIPYLLACGIFGVGINIPFFFYGLKYAPSINAPMIASSGPIFLIIGSMIFLKEKPKSKVIKGTLISLLGVMVIIFRPFLESRLDGAITGNLFFVLATISGVIHSIALKKISSKYSVIALTFWTFLIGALIFTPLFIKELTVNNTLENLNLQGWVGILFGTLLSSIIAYYLFNYGIKKIQANEVGVFAYLDPIIAILIAIPLLNETVTFYYLLGSVFVFLGIFIAEGRIHYHPIKQLLMYFILPLIRAI